MVFSPKSMARWGRSAGVRGMGIDWPDFSSILGGSSSDGSSSGPSAVPSSTDPKRDEVFSAAIRGLTDPSRGLTREQYDWLVSYASTPAGSTDLTAHPDVARSMQKFTDYLTRLGVKLKTGSSSSSSSGGILSDLKKLFTGDTKPAGGAAGSGATGRSGSGTGVSQTTKILLGVTGLGMAAYLLTGKKNTVSEVAMNPVRTVRRVVRRVVR